MLKLKGCPKCKGDVALDRDIHGWFEQCLLCGDLHDATDYIKAPRTEEKEKELVRVG